MSCRAPKGNTKPRIGKVASVTAAIAVIREVPIPTVNSAGEATRDEASTSTQNLTVSLSPAQNIEANYNVRAAKDISYGEHTERLKDQKKDAKNLAEAIDLSQQTYYDEEKEFNDVLRLSIRTNEDEERRRERSNQSTGSGPVNTTETPTTNSGNELLESLCQGVSTTWETFRDFGIEGYNGEQLPEGALDDEINPHPYSLV